MEEVIRKAEVLIEALPYIQSFRGEITVIKLGGSAMADRTHERNILADATFMGCVGMCPVIVHGGGKEISGAMQKRGIEPRFLNGLRVTCPETIKVVEDVMNNVVNPRIVETLREMGARAEGIHGDKVFTAHRKKGFDEKTGEELDWGFVGKPGEVNAAPVRELADRDIIPVITPLGLGTDGNLHNMNGDTAASALAGALKARKLALVSDVPGLLKDRNDSDSLMATLSAGDVEKLIAEGVIAGGMLPKVRGALEAIHKGVQKVHMIDGRMRHSLLLEIFTDKGVGTEMTKDD
jgi:acetylglutamate kinase